MNPWFGLVLIGLLFQRGVELAIAKRNTRWAMARGGYEVGRRHYPLIVAVHALFFVGLIAEVSLGGIHPPLWWELPFLLFVTAQGLRFWCLCTLGPYWNTRILVIPGQKPVVQGPYRWVRHPNYVVVAMELCTLPLVFGSWVTAITVSLLNALVLLRVRIPAEERALTEAVAYGEVMGARPRFIPWHPNGSEKT
ncbi:isoprenylcysteine carboxyl methyltransferase family protein [Salinithrix halophila]|uniref:Isoprenylcysteine carboxyl methyltransferase family protein n=1 Tax=Salinithrix halophila TaxID=1485204 RepID=A0ABV8JFY7_9BACL